MGPAQPSSTLPEMAPPMSSRVLVWWKSVVWNMYLKALRLTAVGPKGLIGTQSAYWAAVAAWVAA